MLWIYIANVVQVLPMCKHPNSTEFKPKNVKKGCFFFVHSLSLARALFTLFSFSVNLGSIAYFLLSTREWLNLMHCKFVMKYN